MAKKTSNAQASKPAAAAPAVGTTLPVVTGEILSANGATGNSGAAGGGTDQSAPAAPAPALITNSAPVPGDASAGTTEEDGGSASGSGDVAASSERLTGETAFDLRLIMDQKERFEIPSFIDQDGNARVIAADEHVIVVRMEKSVKIDGAFLEYERLYAVPLDIWATLGDLEALGE